jgi:ApeA N-terminal domain 1
LELERVLSLWWSPDSPEEQFPGEISTDPDGATIITLIGTLGPIPFPLQNPDPPLLHGIASTGTQYTARQPIGAGGHFGAPGFATERYRARSVVVGGHVDETTLYNEALLEATYLRDWLPESGLRVEVRRGVEGQLGSLGASYQHPPVKSTRVADKATVSTWTSGHGENTRSGYTVSEDVALKIVVDTPVLIDDLIRDYVMPLLDLLSFGTARTNAVDRLTVHSPAFTRAVGASVQPDDLEFLAQWTGKVTGEIERLTPDEMRFGVRDVTAGFEGIATRWFELYPKLRMSFAPYFGLMYAPPTYMDLQLVSISQALEAYHRAVGTTRRILPKDVYSELQRILLEACPETHKEFLSPRLTYLNEPTQVERLTELVQRIQEPLERLLSHRPHFVRDFIAARNLKTHPDPRKRQFSGLEMYDLTRAAMYVFEANVLLDLGFDAAQSKVLFERNPLFAHLADSPPT